MNEGHLPAHSLPDLSPHPTSHLHSAGLPFGVQVVEQGVAGELQERSALITSPFSFSGTEA